jgi:hypothetical protein
MTNRQWHIFTKRQRIYFSIVGAMALIIITIISLWTIDVSVSAMVIDNYTPTTIQMTNGFFLKEPMKTYHMGLWGVIMSTFFLSCLTVYTIAQSIKSDEK